MLDSAEDSIRVLCVDDSPFFLELIKKQLKKIDKTLVLETVTSARAALERIEATNFDVIVADYMMPEMTGLDLLKEIKKRGNSKSFILLTGKGREEIAINALNLGVDFYISKVTDQKILFKELVHFITSAASKKRAQDKRKQAEEYIKLRSHELRSPLTVIQGFSGFLADNIDKLERQKIKEYLNTIILNAGRIEKLIADVNLMSVLQTGKFELDLVSIDFNEFMKEFFDSYKMQLGSQIVCKNNSKIKDCIIMGDEDRLHQVLGNIMHNAQKYTSNDNERLIEVEWEVLQDRVQITISDNGTGIKPTNISRIFEPFVTIPTKQSVKGTGMGLYISKIIVEAHGGSIQARSSGEGGGSTFVIELPRFTE
ncbi:MAG: ATP-binding response regulator [Candidatus Hodarchaeales archaeon]